MTAYDVPGISQISTSDFDYALPRYLIAQEPLEPRDSSRLMVLHRSSGLIEHRAFRDIIDYLRAGDLMVFNDTRVIPARIKGLRKTGGRVELLLLRKDSNDLWEALVRPGRVKDGEIVHLGKSGLVEAEIGRKSEGGTRVVRLSSSEALFQAGEVPLPPYINRPLDVAERYQTVYARSDGSAAAPTAGLHFTDSFLETLRDRGIGAAFVTLHIGLDTFAPVREEDATKHKIHSEYCQVSPETARAVTRCRASGGRVVCVGTTSVRTLEAVAYGPCGEPQCHSGSVDLFILPGYCFKVTDMLVTNFHLPRTTLLMLVSAFAGRELILKAYQEAIDHEYRFYSFGDAMLIL